MYTGLVIYHCTMITQRGETMTLQNKLLHTPDGVRDYLPSDFAAKATVERLLEDAFSSYGYMRVSSPMFEYADVFDEKGSVTQTAIYKFIDRDGSVLALRSDMTPQIARMASTLYRAADVPMRFSYVENTFRYNESYQGKLKEFTQAGVELIGVNSDEASAEVVALSVNCLLSVGLRDFRIDVGQVQFFQGILEEGGFDEDTCKQMRASIIARDYVAVEKAARAANVPESVGTVLSELPLLIGGVEVLQKARSMTSNKTALAALSNLENIADILRDCGLEEYIAFDLSMVGHLDYYTGIIFRGYAYGTGSSVLDGGRYDQLIRHFGADYPSVGFGIKVGVLLEALAAQNTAGSITVAADTLLAYAPAGRRAAMQAASVLRKQGVQIENSLLGGDFTANESYARRRGMKGMLCFTDEDNVRMLDLTDGTERLVRLRDLLVQASKEGEGEASCGI